jgi:hypothetical protein
MNRRKLWRQLKTVWDYELTGVGEVVEGGGKKASRPVLTWCYQSCRLGGAMVSVLVIEHKAQGFKPGRGDECLRAIKTHNTTSFGGKEKPRAVLYIQTGSGAHPAFCTMGTGGPFPGG